MKIQNLFLIFALILLFSINLKAQIRVGKITTPIYNNTGKPDLIITQILVNVEGDTSDIVVSVKNIGTADCNSPIPVRLSKIVIRDWDPIQDKIDNGLIKNQIKLYHIKVLTSDLLGTPRIKATVDPDGLIDEVNNYNNEMEKYFIKII